MTVPKTQIDDEPVFYEKIEKLVAIWLPKQLSTENKATRQCQSYTARDVQSIIVKYLDTPWFSAAVADDKSYFDQHWHELSEIDKRRSLIIACLSGNNQTGQYLLNRIPVNPARETDIFTYVAFSENPYWINTLMKQYFLEVTDLPAACTNELFSNCYELYEKLEGLSATNAKTIG